MLNYLALLKPGGGYGHIHMVVGIAESWREVLYSSLIRYIYVCEIDKITEGKNLKCIGVDIFC